MTPTKERPAPAVTERRGADLAPAKKQPQYTRRCARNPSMMVRKLPEGEAFIVRGRAAQTLALLIEVGDKGFNSGEASPLGWARRTSAYVFVLRESGLDIATDRERVADASVARYRLNSRIEVLDNLEGGQ